MGNVNKSSSHAAEAAALGFYYQTFYALLTLLKQNTNNATVSVEQLDDVELATDNQVLLIQLKHSIKDLPPAITTKATSLWKTLKVWIDALPNIELSETTLHLVACGKIPKDSPLLALTDLNTDRSALSKALYFYSGE